MPYHQYHEYTKQYLLLTSINSENNNTFINEIIYQIVKKAILPVGKIILKSYNTTLRYRKTSLKLLSFKA